MNLELPYPPSANRYWRVWRGRAVKSDEAREYQAKVRRLYARARPLAGPVSVTLEVYRPIKRGDLDNSLKVTLDALKGVAFLDDAQVKRLTATQHDATKATARVEVRVVPLDDGEAAAHAAGELRNRHTDECIEHLTDPGATCVCRPPAVAEPLVGRVTPNAQRPR